MSSNPSLPQPMAPLSIGNVISAALRLYRDRFKSYLGVAFRATLWQFVPLLLQILIALITRQWDTSNTDFDGLRALLLIVLLPIQIYCTAKSLTNFALISRLAFNELINKPETVRQGTQQLRRRTWLFWLTQFLLGLLIIIIFVFSFLALVVLIAFLTGFIKNEVLIFLLGLILFTAFLGVCLWVYARFFIPEVPLAVENNINSFDAINRSWSLSKGFAWKIVWIITVAFLITLPVYFLAGIPILAAIGSVFPDLSTGDTLPTQASVTIVIGIFTAILIFLLLNIATIPFWQAIKGVIYYDLRSRREGLGLNLRDSNIAEE